MRAAVHTMRRWGISWRRILLCLCGFHGHQWKGICPRCGNGGGVNATIRQTGVNACVAFNKEWTTRIWIDEDGSVNVDIEHCRKNLMSARLQDHKAPEFSWHDEAGLEGP